MDRGPFAPTWRLVGGVLLFWGAFAVLSALALFVHLPLTGQVRPPFMALLVYTATENAY